MTNLHDFITRFAIPCDAPTKPGVQKLWDAQIDQLFADTPDPDESRIISFQEFRQLQLPVYLRFFHENRPCMPGRVLYEALAAAGWPALDWMTWPRTVNDGLRLWSSGLVVEPCTENAALLLDRAADPAAVASAAGFDSIDSCLTWAEKLPHANLLDVKRASLDELLWRIENGI